MMETWIRDLGGSEVRDNGKGFPYEEIIHNRDCKFKHIKNIQYNWEYLVTLYKKHNKYEARYTRHHQELKDLYI
jgi:hypothetical protein